MKFIADLHIHSPFSRATSKDSTPGNLAAWAALKGIQLIGTGDFTHPGWLQILKEQLIPAEPGVYRLKDASYTLQLLPEIKADAESVRFILSAEISSIYKRSGKTRKVHNLLYMPDFEVVERLNRRLAKVGNLLSDGRPLLGLDCRDLLEMMLDCSSDAFMVPAHIWTPWFSVFGSKSGFDTIEECFGDLAGHIFALETGLSSNPEMNRLISALDRFTFISNSDCHSPSKLGREANLFDTGLDFYSLRRAIEANCSDSFIGTIEFFPEEGKYHLDGHRECQICLEPSESRQSNNICRVCKKPLTIGVLNRVLELADRHAPEYKISAPQFYSLIPLVEILGELMQVGSASKRVMQHYMRLISEFKSEFNLLLFAGIDEIDRFDPLLAESILRMRDGQVLRQSGFDGQYGKIRLFQEGELDGCWGWQR